MLNLCLMFSSLAQAEFIQVGPTIVTQNARNEEGVCALLSAMPALREIGNQDWRSVNQSIGTMSFRSYHGSVMVHKYCLTPRGIMWEIGLPNYLGNMFIFSEQARSHFLVGLTPLDAVSLVCREFFDLIGEWVASKENLEHTYKNLPFSATATRRRLAHLLREKFANNELMITFYSPRNLFNMWSVKLEALERQCGFHIPLTSSISGFNPVPARRHLRMIDAAEWQEIIPLSHPFFHLPLPDLRATDIINLDTGAHFSSSNTMPVGSLPTVRINTEENEAELRRRASRGRPNSEEADAIQRRAILEDIEDRVRTRFRTALLNHNWTILYRWWDTAYISDQDREEAFKKAVQCASTDGPSQAEAYQWVVSCITDPHFSSDIKIDTYRNLISIEEERRTRHVQQLIVRLRGQVPIEIISEQEGLNFDIIEQRLGNNISVERLLQSASYRVGERRTTMWPPAVVVAQPPMQIMSAEEYFRRFFDGTPPVVPVPYTRHNLHQETPEHRVRAQMAQATAVAHEIHNYTHTNIEVTDEHGNNEVLSIHDAIFEAVKQQVKVNRWVISRYRTVY